MKTIGKKREKIITSCLAMAGLAIMVFLAGVLPSLAARKTGTIINDNTIVYTLASTDSSHLCRLNRSAKVTVIEEVKDSTGAVTWYDVYFLHDNQAKDGYVQASQINFGTETPTTTAAPSTNTPNTPNTSQAGKTGLIIKPNVNVRSASSTSSTSLYRLAKDTKVTVISEETGSDSLTWYKVYFVLNGEAKEGYVRSDMITGLTASGQNPTTPTTPTTPNTSTVSKTGKIRVRNTNVRAGASLESVSLYRLPQDTAVNITQEVKNTDGSTWYKVSFTTNGSAAEGYVRADMITLTTQNTGSQTGTTISGGTGSVNKANINVRTQASTGSTRVCRLAKGTRVNLLGTVTGDDGLSWYKVSFTYGGQTTEGYIRSDLISR